jgi:formylglycine-generating enzyme required for sulfatase activity
VGISWYEAEAYCTWLSHHLAEVKPDWWQPGLEVALPSEAQWEYAARGGEGRTYPWGAQAPDSEHANFGNPEGQTNPVGCCPRGQTPAGLCDMAGNVWEWCLDAWDGAAYRKRLKKGDKKRNIVNNPVTFGNTAIRVLRGGAWGSGARALRAAYRDGDHAGYRFRYFGFRCVLLLGRAEP